MVISVFFSQKGRVFKPELGRLSYLISCQTCEARSHSGSLPQAIANMRIFPWGALAVIGVYFLSIYVFFHSRDSKPVEIFSTNPTSVKESPIVSPSWVVPVYQRPADKITFGIKTFGRGLLTLRLAQSIRAQGYESPIVIADDGNDTSAGLFSAISNVKYIKLAFNVGLSAGRNAAVELATTPYYMTLDDDFVFTNGTTVDALVSLLEARNLDFVSGRLGGSSSVGYFAESTESIYYCTDQLSNMARVAGTKLHPPLHN